MEKDIASLQHTTWRCQYHMKWNGNNCYTILPIQQATDAFYQQAMNRLKEDVEHQRVAKLLQEPESPA